MAHDFSYSTWVSILYRYRKIFMSKALERYGALSGYSLLILTIHNIPGTNQEQIASMLKTSKAVITKGVRKLEGEGYLRREPDEIDKRAYKVYLTEKAEALVPEIERAISEWEKLVSSDVSEEDLNVMRRCLKKLAENAIRDGDQN